jgi:hypothetical protein
MSDAKPQGGSPKKKLPKQPIDTTEYEDDLRRQNEEFLRTRTGEYFDLARSATHRLAKPGSYKRHDLTSDAWTLWGMWSRDVVDAGLRSLRTLNRIAEDTPVPTEPYRRVSEAFAAPDSDRPMHVRCSDLVARQPTSGGRFCDFVITAAEVEISPNPVRCDDETVVVSVNAAAHRGNYQGELTFFHEHPGKAVAALDIAIWVRGKFDRW